MIIHDYGSVSTLTLWETIEDDLLPLIHALRHVMEVEDRG